MTLIHAGVLVQFDAMHSLEISEKIKRVRWCARPNSSLLMLAANDRTVKLWKVLLPNDCNRWPVSMRNGLSITDSVAPGQVSEHKAAKKGNDRPPRWGTTAALSLKEPPYYSEWAATKPRGGSSGDPDERPEKVYSPQLALLVAMFDLPIKLS
jgi:serine/threonine-protein phosphatase 2A regulatory subunit B